VPAGFIQRTNQGNAYSGQTPYPFDLVSNPTLGPETATNKTLGFVYSPSYLRGFDVSVDWWEISLENAISRPSAGYILNQCFVEGDQGFCDIANGLGGLTRDALGTINNFNLGLLNLAQTEVEGFDVTARYRLPDTAYGNFGFVLDSSYISRYESRSTPEGEWNNVVGEYSQSSPTWRLRSNFTADWNMGDFGARWTARYVSGLVEACPTFAKSVCSDPDRRIAAGAAPQNRLPATTYHDIQARYNTPWNATVSVGVNNVFDKEPPVSYQAFANSFDYQYDTPGQFYYMEYRQRF
jgi:iron complex outermembrane receptor protein